MTAVSRQSKPAILTSAEEPMPIVNESTLIKQAAEVSTGDAQKLGRLVSRELFVKPAKEKSLKNCVWDPDGLHVSSFCSKYRIAVALPNVLQSPGIRTPASSR